MKPSYLLSLWLNYRIKNHREILFPISEIAQIKMTIDKNEKNKILIFFSYQSSKRCRQFGKVFPFFKSIFIFIYMCILYTHLCIHRVQKSTISVISQLLSPRFSDEVSHLPGVSGVLLCLLSEITGTGYHKQPFTWIWGIN